MAKLEKLNNGQATFDSADQLEVPKQIIWVSDSCHCHGYNRTLNKHVGAEISSSIGSASEIYISNSTHYQVLIYCLSMV